MPPKSPWKIPPPGDCCSLTGKPFAEGDIVFSVLLEGPEEGAFQRLDYSQSSWREIQPRLQPFCYWRSVHEPKATREPDRGPNSPMQDAERLLQRLSEQAEPATEKVRYVLALSLERKKILRQVGQEQIEQRRLLVYQHVPSGEVWLVPDPGIRLEHLAETEREIRHWLEAEGRA